MSKYRFDLGANDLDLSQYFGVWAVEPTRFRQMLAHAQHADLAAHVAANRQADVASPRVDIVQEGPSREATIAVLHITGTMTKRGSSYGAGSSVLLRRELRQAAEDKSIDGILLVIDSPGGSVAGTADLAAEVNAARSKKPVYAQVDDCACSAAYWVASQAEKVFANDRTAIVGSIGTYMGLYDESDKYAADGVKPVLVCTGQYKGAGFPGTAITDAQRAHFQEIIDQTQVSFSRAVADGRGLSDDDVAELADGRVWMADQAATLKLIDGVQSIDATLSQLATETANQRGTADMAASVNEIKSACPGATPAFIVSQVEANADLETVRTNWMHELARQNAALRAEKDRKEEERKEEERKEKRSKKAKKGKRSKKAEDDDPDADDDLDADDELESDEDPDADDDPEADEDPDADDDPEADEDPDADDDLEAEDKDKQSRARSRRRLQAMRSRRGARRVGHKPLPYGKGKRSSAFADPAAEFRSAVNRKIKTGLPRARAVAAVVAEQPELHRAYVASHNAAHGRR